MSALISIEPKGKESIGNKSQLYTWWCEPAIRLSSNRSMYVTEQINLHRGNLR